MARDYEGAAISTKKAKNLSIAAINCGICITVIYVVIRLVVLQSNLSTGIGIF